MQFWNSEGSIWNALSEWGGRYLIGSALLPRMRMTVGSVLRSRGANYRIRVASREQLSTWRNTDNTLQRAYYVLTSRKITIIKMV